MMAGDEAMNAQPQSLIGLPEHKVELDGSPESPFVVNHSAKTIVAYVLRKTHDTGAVTVDLTRANPKTLAPGLPIGPGASNITQVAENVAQRAALAIHWDGTPVVIQSASLDFVLFSDGTYGGPNKGDFFMVMERGFKLGKDDALKALLDPNRLAQN
jgi:hypothetical protein